MSAAAFRQLLEDGDVEGLRAAWHEVAPGMPQPQSRAQAEQVMHMARVESSTVAFKHRAYSHRWLTERDLPSTLPDHLRPSAERMYPRVVEGVGVSVEFKSKLLAPAAAEIRGAINDAIEECYADGRTDVTFVRARMDDARERSMRQLFGLGVRGGR